MAVDPYKMQSIERSKGSKQRLRLMISIPAIMSLLTIAMGVISYQIVAQNIRGALSSSPGLPGISQILDYLIIAIVMMVLLSIFGGVALAVGITKPIKTLTQTALSIATGDLTHHVDIDGVDEIGELGETFNEMINALHRITVERNRFILESFTGGLITTDKHGSVAAINSAAAKIFDCDATTILNRPILSLVPNNEQNQEYRSIVEDAIKDCKHISGKEATIVNKSEESFLIGLTVNLIREADDSVVGYIFNFRDLRELKRFHEQMQRTDRLAAVGTFSTGIAHEIRNPLGSIKGMAQLLGEDLKNDVNAKKYIDVIITEVNRLDNVVKELLDFSQPGTSGIMEYDLNILLRESVHLVRNDLSIPYAKEMTIRESYNLIPPLVLQPEKMIQAFLNIVRNAVQASGPDGQVFVRTKFDRNTKCVVVEIENTNSTIPEEILDKIFDPFFTTKEDGVGLGLSITYQIIVNHQGTLEVKSENGRTAFIVSFAQ